MQISPIWQEFSVNLQKNHEMTATNSKNFVKKWENLHDMACQDMKNKALYATRQLAKRQSTWQRQLNALPQFAKANEMNKIKTGITNAPQSQQRIFSFASIKDAQNEILA